MLNYIKENYGNRPSVNEGEMQELEFLRKTVESLRAELSKPTQNVKSTASDKDSDSEGSESEGDYVEDLPVSKKIAKAGNARQSVSAEVFGKFNLQVEHVPPFYQKTPEEEEAIKLRMKGNFMFEALNPKDKKAIIGAIVHKRPANGDVVIK